MRHVSITCKNHPELRWSCKDVAWNFPGYNGSRGIFFSGRYTGKLHSDGSGAECEPADECSCPVSDLRTAPEDKEIAKACRKAEKAWEAKRKEGSKK